jgi:F-type H+-transporting ATPase subunit delta
MGSATRNATNVTHVALKKTLPASLATAEALFGAAAVIGASSQLRSTLSNPAIEISAKQGLVAQVFGKGLDKGAATLLGLAIEQRWSSESDLVAGIEDVALRCAASSVKTVGAIEAELFAFARAISSDADLELALGSKLGNPDAKATLARNLLTKAKALPATVAIVSSLVRSPRGRRIGALLSTAAQTVADQSGCIVATVTSAQPLDSGQVNTVAAVIALRYGRKAVLNAVVDPGSVGGVRIQVGNDVIDGSIATMLEDLRAQLAG